MSFLPFAFTPSFMNFMAQCGRKIHPFRAVDIPRDALPHKIPGNNPPLWLCHLYIYKFIYTTLKMLVHHNIHTHIYTNTCQEFNNPPRLQFPTLKLSSYSSESLNLFDLTLLYFSMAPPTKYTSKKKS